MVLTVLVLVIVLMPSISKKRAQVFTEGDS
jgi:competence protein ComGC